MKEVTVKVEDLIKTLQTNGERHATTFEKALEGYKAKCLELLEDRIAQLRAGKTPDMISIRLMEPEDHTEDYDTAIQMLDRHQEKTITLTQREFRNFVEDKWDWTDQWTLSNSQYLES